MVTTMWLMPLLCCQHSVRAHPGPRSLHHEYPPRGILAPIKITHSLAHCGELTDVEERWRYIEKFTAEHAEAWSHVGDCHVGGFGTVADRMWRRTVVDR